ncbi:LacI family DNA-binding transcriptional regulator [Kutzneria chonburiensis]|uniref:LacI family DNA-binding transcriptional regulator n=1 Tax=Kutzneria chonburiensis TaxID=1483604 RepID=A0ABV6MME2_9PSEU|nr:LacI family DNA-binding transcriptional regulator [Kutzneria chonburiensis]
MAVTLRDVARMAGVSIKTASNVVNGYSFVKPENRRRVEEALAATGYRPNIGARNLRRGRTGFIALVVPELGIPYFGELAGLVITAGRELGWNVLIEQTQASREGERAVLSALGPHLIDAAVISPEALHAADFAELDPGVPLVMIGEHSVDVRIDRVAIDNVLAARLAVGHLVEIGRRRIAAIGAHPTRGTSELRLAGYRQALADAGLPELVRPALSYHRQNGAAAMASLLDLPEPPDAVFCFNDLLAIGAMRAIADRGLRVPEDIAVVGFDNTEEGAYSRPTLTSIAPDKLAIARTAVELARRRIEAEEPFEPEDIQTPFTLAVRESTAG